MIVKQPNCLISHLTKATALNRNALCVSLSHIMGDYPIVAALINCFFPKLYTDADNEEIAMRMNIKITSKTLSLDKYFESVF
jgi:hypothetical protein